MAKARWAKGLRTGSTKTETYSTLNTAKEGRIQIVKDRVYDVANPQSDGQMSTRVAFATVTQAASRLSELIGISWEAVTNKAFAKQAFISVNAALLRKYTWQVAGSPVHPLAVFAPKGNKQIIPNSYIVSNGTLTPPAWMIVDTANNKGSFGATSFANIKLSAEIAAGNYTVAELWAAIYGVQPGDQLSFPQLYGDVHAQEYFVSDAEGALPVDWTLQTGYAVPRVVLLDEMPSTTLAVSTSTTSADLVAHLLLGVDTDKSWGNVVDSWIGAGFTVTAGTGKITVAPNVKYDTAFAANDDDVIRALGIILSRRDSNGIWRMNKCQLCCVWGNQDQFTSRDYYGFTYANARASYMASVKMTPEGNFLQTGGEDDILPTSFR